MEAAVLFTLGALRKVPAARRHRPRGGATPARGAHFPLPAPAGGAGAAPGVARPGAVRGAAAPGLAGPLRRDAPPAGDLRAAGPGHLLSGGELGPRRPDPG